MLHQIIQNQPHDIDERVKCPKCAEWIRFEAKMCPHCKSDDDGWKRGMITAIKAKEEEMVQAGQFVSTLIPIIVILAIAIALVVFYKATN